MSHAYACMKNRTTRDFKVIYISGDYQQVIFTFSSRFSDASFNFKQSLRQWKMTEFQLAR